MFHVLNRAARRLRLFETPEDYREFFRCVAESRERFPLRILAYCVMPNHFHLVLWPTHDGQLASFMHLMTGTHARRWHVRRASVGEGAVYQSRYKAIPVQNDGHFFTVCRYVERNAANAGLVDRAEDWPWSSLGASQTSVPQVPIDEWPVARPSDWAALVNTVQFETEVQRVREAIRSGRPYGDGAWASEVSRRLGLEGTNRPPGRPPKTHG